jgi:hypothetical protein
MTLRFDPVPRRCFEVIDNVLAALPELPSDFQVTEFGPYVRFKAHHDMRIGPDGSGIARARGNAYLLPGEVDPERASNESMSACVRTAMKQMFDRLRSDIGRVRATIREEGRVLLDNGEEFVTGLDGP